MVEFLLTRCVYSLKYESWAGIDSDPGVESLKSVILGIWTMLDLGSEIWIFEERYLGSDLLNSIDGLIWIQIFQEFLSSSDVNRILEYCRVLKKLPVFCFTLTYFPINLSIAASVCCRGLVAMDHHLLLCHLVSYYFSTTF